MPCRRRAVREKIRPDPRHADVVARLAMAIRTRDAVGAEEAIRRLMRHRRDQMLAALEAAGPAHAPARSESPSDPTPNDPRAH